MASRALRSIRLAFAGAIVTRPSEAVLVTLATSYNIDRPVGSTASSMGMLRRQSM